MFDPTQAPDWQVSVCVQAFPSSQALPFVLAGFEHWAVDVLQLPTLWHWSCAVQTTGFDRTHAPDWQVSVCVHAFPSLHEVPFVLAGFEHWPVELLQVPTS